MSHIIISAQNFHIYDGDGLDPFARTGSVSINMLVGAGASGVILGHPEIGDGLTVVHNKLKTIENMQKNDLETLKHSTIIVGDSWEEYSGNSNGEIAKIVGSHLKTIIKGVNKKTLLNCVYGYDPRWGSRGSGKDDVPPPSPKLISACAKNIRGILASFIGAHNSRNIPVIYGGRSTPERTEEILSDENVDGLILGSACNTVEKTMAIAQAMQKTMKDRKKILHANFKAFNLVDSYKKYLTGLLKLDDSYTAYVSPCFTDIREVAKLCKPCT